MSDLEWSDEGSEDGENVIIFNAAANHIQNIHKNLQKSDLLELYALYKQATCGKCNTSEPGILQFEARAKFNAWKNLGDMSQQEAQMKYIEKVNVLDPKFAEELKKKSAIQNSNWVVHSTLVNPDDEIIHNQQKNVFDCVREGNLEELKSKFSKLTPEKIKDQILELDEGLGLLHWAADRNFPHIIEYLLEIGAHINQIDQDGQTALHFAACCEHRECLSILLKHGANVNIKDSDGNTCIDVTENQDVRDLLATYM